MSKTIWLSWDQNTSGRCSVYEQKTACGFCLRSDQQPRSAVADTVPDLAPRSAPAPADTVLAPAPCSALAPAADTAAHTASGIRVCLHTDAAED